MPEVHFSMDVSITALFSGDLILRLTKLREDLSGETISDLKLPVVDSEFRVPGISEPIAPHASEFRSMHAIPADAIRRPDCRHYHARYFKAISKEKDCD